MYNNNIWRRRNVDATGDVITKFSEFQQNKTWKKEME